MPPTSAQRPSSSDIAPIAKPRWICGLLLATTALTLCILLVLSATRSLALPGCGEASPCDQAAKSPYARVGGVSVAVLGAAYYAAVGTAWGLLRGRVGAVVRGMVALGVVVSVGYVGIMLTKSMLCVYCLASHLCNFGLAACVLPGVRGTHKPKQWAGAALAATVGLFAFAPLYTVDANARALAKQRADTDLALSIQRMTTPPPAPEPEPSPSPTPAPTSPTAPILTGRHAWGPESSRLRIVMFTDYQCPDCALLEQQLTRVQQEFPDALVAIRHYPVSTVCNPNVSQDRHPDACFAAFASEAAGQMGGRDAFWTMHHWLFSRKGSFTKAQLVEQARVMGLDGQRLLALMETPGVKGLVSEDIALAQRLGIAYTPMIFVNGVELKGYTAPDALVRTARAVASTNAAPQLLGSDIAPTARERAIAEFWAQPQRILPERLVRRLLGPTPDGPGKGDVTVVLIGDYLEPGTREADTLLRVFTRGPGETIRYAYAHFPIDQACNPSAPFTKFAGSCIASRLSEGADLMAGPDAFWGAHDWLMTTGNEANLTAERGSTSIANALPALMLDPALLSEAMTQDYTSQQIAEDAKAALSLGVTSLPAIYVDGHLVPTWKVGGENIVPALVTMVRERRTQTAK